MIAPSSHLLLLLALVSSVAARAQTALPTVSVIADLVPGKRIEKTIQPGAVHRYRLSLPDAHCVEIAADQRGADLTLLLTTRQGEPVAGDGSEDGLEKVIACGEGAGVVTFSIKSITRRLSAGHYTLTVGTVHRRASVDEEKSAIAAQATRAKMLLSNNPNGSQLHAALDLRLAGRAKAHELGDRQLELSLTLGVGEALHALGRFVEAKATFQAASVLSEELADQRSKGEALNNLAACEWPLAEMESAGTHLEQAYAAFAGLRLDYALAGLHSNRGLILWQTGLWRDAVTEFRLALDLNRKVKDPSVEAMAVHNLSLVYVSLGDYETAIPYLERALRTFRTTAQHVQAGRTLSILGRVRLSTGDMESARRNATEAVSILKSYGDKRSQAEALNNHAQVLESRLPQTARQLYEESLSMFREVGDARGTATCLHNAGRLKASSGHADEALEALREARSIRRKIRLAEAEATSAYEIARVHLTAGDLTKAERVIKEAIELTDAIQVNVPGERLRSTFFAERADIYKLALRILVEHHQKDPSAGFDRTAFDIHERFLNRVPLGRLPETVGAQADQHLLRRLKAAQQILYVRNIAFLNAAPSDRSQVQQATRLLDDALAEYRTLSDEVQAPTRESTPVSFTINELQSRLPDGDTVLLRYALNEPRSHVWLVTRSEVVLMQLGSGSAIERSAKAFVNAVRHRELSPSRRVVRDHLRELSWRLLSRLPSRLLFRRRLIIVSEGALVAVPFSALLVPTTSNPLVESHEVVSLPSGSALAAIRRPYLSAAGEPRGLLVIADPVYGFEDDRARSFPRSKCGTAVSLRRLPLSEIEANAIMSLNPSRRDVRLSGFSASTSALARQDLMQFRVIHVSAHGSLDMSRPELSAVTLSQVNERGECSDGLLRASAVAEMRLNADLVTLMGCETALGKTVRSEGLAMGLIPAFLRAGARQVLATLWNVDEGVALAFSKSFYRAYLIDGKTASAALRHAQQALRQNPAWRSPEVYGAFVLTGDWR